MNVSPFVSKWIKKKEYKRMLEIEPNLHGTSLLQSGSCIIVALLSLTYWGKPMLSFKGFTLMELKILRYLKLAIIFL
jgi:hypothetical protein